MGALSRLFSVAPRAATQSPQELERIITAHYGGTNSGAHVTPDTALQVGAVFACVRVLAEDVAKLPVILYRRTADGGKERAVEHPLHVLMHDQPNGFQTSFEFREMMQAHLALRGNAYAFVVRVGGRPVELLPIHPDRVKAKISDDWSVTYEVRTGGGRGGWEPFGPADILHLRGLATDGLIGLSPATMAREAIGLAMAAESHGARFFSNGAKPGLVVTHPKTLSPTARANIKDGIEDATAGANIFRVLLLEEGMSATAVGLNQEDAQYVESRKFQIPEIARWYRMPPHKIQDLDRSTNNNIEHQGQEYLTDTLDPWLTRWRQRLNMSLLNPAERRVYFFDFLTEALVRGDIASRYGAYAIAVNTGWMNPNEVRVRENLNPAPGLDEFRRPLNMDAAGAPRPAA